MKLAAVGLVVAVATAGAVPAVQDRPAAADGCDVRALLYQDSPTPRLWTDAAGRPTPLAHAALSVLDDAAADGLDAADYGTAALRQLAVALGAVAPALHSQSAEFDLSLSHAMVHFVLDLRRGRIDPREVGIPLVAGDGREALEVLRQAVARGQLTSLARDAAPQLAAYAALRSALASYRGLSFAASARQIELSLERLRWLPAFESGPVVVINIPAFRLWAWDAADPAGRPMITMRVIVGRASQGRTPVLVSAIESVVVRPFWNVPSSIVKGEILPKLARDPHYLERQRMDIVSGAGTPSMKLRQRPGPANALGLLKFVFPNALSVYIHGTPLPLLFERERRDLSHGCIRAEDPAALAEWLLHSDEWSRDRIDAATAGAETRIVQLPRPVPVVLFYSTAYVGPDDGVMHFVPDVYGYDRRLENALGRRSRTLPAIR